MCAALVPSGDCEGVREQLRPLLLPGQIKFHWTDESDGGNIRLWNASSISVR